MWPIAIIGLAVFAYAIGKGKSPVSIGNSRTTDVGRQLPAAKPPTALQRLHRVIHKGGRPSEWLISEAVREAYNHGDYVLADKILSAFDKQESSQSASEAPVSPPPGDVASAVPAAATPGVPPAPEPRSYSSPIEHVPDDEWSAFANAMRIHDPDFETDRHVGAFHQRKDRLKQLRLEAGKGDEESQYKAFVADCLNHMEQKALINEYVTSVVKIGPDEHVVTASGLLGLMKAAGPKNAVHWITHPDEQEKFPKTTDIFIRCNGIF